MQSVYIILLTISASSALIYKHTSEDISFVLAILTGLISLFWGFACSPLIFQLFIVLSLFCCHKVYLLDSEDIN